MKNRTRMICALGVNLFIFVSTLLIALNGVINGPGEGQLGNELTGGMYFMPYTIDSNVLLGAFSLLCSVFIIIALIKKKDTVPAFVHILRFIASSSTTLTFVTVLFFLAPMQLVKGESFFIMFRGDMFFFHFFNPVISVLSLIILERPLRFSHRECFLAIIPTFVYSWVYFFNVMVFSNWDDIYGFSFGGRMWVVPIVFIVMYSANYLASYIITRIMKKINNE